MNTQKEKDKSSQTTWVGVCCVVPEEGSFQQRRGLQAGYGFVAFRSLSIASGVESLAFELADGGTRLVGFEWLSRLEDNERDLTASDLQLIEKLKDYPVQFYEIHWFISED